MDPQQRAHAWPISGVFSPPGPEEEEKTRQALALLLPKLLGPVGCSEWEWELEPGWASCRPARLLSHWQPVPQPHQPHQPNPWRVCPEHPALSGIDRQDRCWGCLDLPDGREPGDGEDAQTLPSPCSQLPLPPPASLHPLILLRGVQPRARPQGAGDDQAPLGVCVCVKLE